MSGERSERDALLWFGVLGAPLAWFAQLLAAYSLEEWFACSPATSTRGEVLGLPSATAAIVVAVACGAVALASGMVSLGRLRRSTDAEAGPGGRVRWMALAGVMNAVLYLILIAASFGPPLILDRCEVSP